MISRPLGPMERWYWICDQLSPLNVIARVRIAGDLAVDDLERAAALLVAEHPLLQVAVDPDGPRFVPTPNPRVPVRVARSGDWQREVADVELVSSVDWRTGPLARLVVVAGQWHDLILTVSHVIADGTTALHLLRRLVELAAGAPPAPRPPLPPVEHLLPNRINGARLVTSVIADRVTAVITRPRRLAPAVRVEPEHRRTRLVRRELDATRLVELTERCRREGVTVHSALCAALAIAVAGTRTGRVTIGSPVDFRAELVPPVGPMDAGAYVATVPSHVRVGPDLWAVARAAFLQLRRRRRLGQHLTLVALLRLMSPRSVDTSTRAVAMVDRIGPGNVCLSNVGRFDFPDRIGGWALSGAQFIAGVSVSGYLVAAVTTSHGSLHWNFTHIDGAVPADVAERIADRVERALLAGTRGDHREQARHRPRHRRVVGTR